MTMITPSYLGETIEYSSLHACRSTLEDPTLKRIVRNYNGDMNKLRFIDVIYYILRKDGAYAGVSLWEGYSKGHPHKIAIHDGNRRAEICMSLLKGHSQTFPPFPDIPEDLKNNSEYLK